MSATIKLAVGLLILSVLAVATPAAQGTKRDWNFNDETIGQIAKGFTNEVGEWTVVATDSGKALSQGAKNASPVFNVALASDTSAKTVDLSVRLKSVAGEIDQGGGLVWRAKDAKNYYIARYNPLEENYRVYKVENGRRTQLKNANISEGEGWHTLRVTMVGDQIQCYYDGKKHLDVTDPTFPDAGKIGLWTKADAQTQFDDLTLITP